MMEERMRTAVNYIIRHKPSYKEEAIRASLAQSGYKVEEIDDAFSIYRRGGVHDSFFQKETFVRPDPNKRKFRFPHAEASLIVSLVPVLGFIYAYWASEKINRENLLGRELALYAMVINVIVTLFAILLLIR